MESIEKLYLLIIMKKYTSFYTLIGQLQKADSPRGQADQLQFLPMFLKERRVDLERIIAQKSELNALLFDEGRNLILKVPLGVSGYCSGESSFESKAVRGYIPHDEKTAGISFELNGRIIQELTVPPVIPGLLIPTRFEKELKQEKVELKWSISDPQNLPFISKVFFSNTDGKSWIPVGSRTSKSAMEIETKNLPGGSLCCFAVQISDGYRNARVETERFSVPEKSPILMIIQPSPGAVLKSGDLIQLHGQGFDINSQEPILDDLLWESSIQGKLEMGSSAHVKLRKGKHKLSLSWLGTNVQKAESIEVVVV
jgi:hypothetical protein